ncbi:YdcF family protein [Planktothrix paucivesiculata]|uniref:DUF218 domain-containing protein n=1 Tax=Planktothrix paucivesiculata PCC 9631 TaxID=671071 RepID=A0A7Z9BW40_9CYAN|nr:YdcF family protein [Planktothrix paucivesiculata]VXD19974.1 conserved membrane hypothetical protein [Planktothrix paucivesiculata PCC 9631]
MFVILTRVLFLLLVAAIIFKAWEILGDKNNGLFNRLLFVLFLILIVVAFISPDSQVGAVVLGILSILFRPLGLSILLLLIASIFIKNGKIDKPGPSLILVALLILIVSSTPVFANWLAQQVERVALKTVQTDLCCGERAGAIVLLGQGTTEPKLSYRKQIQLTDTGDRIPYAAQLFRQDRGPFIIVSAGPRHELVNPLIEANDVKQLLVYMGIPSDRIVLETHGGTTHNNAVEIYRIMQNHRLGRTIILVTSALEMRRASLAFTRVGFKVIPAPTNFYTFVHQKKYLRHITGADFAPSAEALLLTTRVINEYFLTFYYFIRGWLAPMI